MSSLEVKGFLLNIDKRDIKKYVVPSNLNYKLNTYTANSKKVVLRKSKIQITKYKRKYVTSHTRVDF